jgi:hypothetical protein
MLSLSGIQRQRLSALKNTFPLRFVSSQISAQQQFSPAGEA